MTDNEIIKAFECCYAKGKTCNDCPTNDFECTNIEKMALDLINRQKAELTRAKDYIELLEIEKQALKEDSNKSKAAAMEVIKKQDAEIERLKNDLAKEFVCFVGSPHKVESCPFFDELKNERAEAVKECIEKIKSKASKSVMTDNGIPVAGSASYFISEVELYKIEKEMAGDAE